MAGRAGPDPADDGRQPRSSSTPCPTSTTSSTAWPSIAQAAPRLAGGSTTRPAARTRPAGPATRRSTPVTTCACSPPPPPGDLRQVLDLVGLVDATQFETVRSPWDVTVIEGLDGGRAALYLRADHVLTDGVGGVELMQMLLDGPDPARAPTRPPRRWRQRRRSRRPSTPTARRVPPTRPLCDPPPALTLVAERRPGTVTMTVDLTSLARPVATGIGAARHARSRRHRRARRPAGRRDGQLGVPPARRPRRAAVPLTPSGSMGTRFEVAVDARGAPGGGPPRRRAATSSSWRPSPPPSAPTTSVRASPSPSCAWPRRSSCRTRRSGGGNSFAPLRVEVPATVGHPTTHFGVVADRLARARREPAMHLTGPLTTAINLLPSRVLLRRRAGPDRHRGLHRHRAVGAADVRLDLRRHDPRQLPVRSACRPPRQRHGARQRRRPRSRHRPRSRCHQVARRVPGVPRGGVRPADRRHPPTAGSGV